MPEYPNPKLRPVPPPPEAPPPVGGRLAYAELEVATNFSFLRGASHPDELVYRAAELGYRAIAVTDRNSLAGAVRMHEAAKKVGVKLVVGARLVLADAPDLLVWAPDRPAYARLCRLLTTGKRRAEKGHSALWLNDVLDAADSGLLTAVVAPAAGLFDRAGQCAVGLLREAMGDRLSLAASRLYGGDDRRRLRDLADVGRALGVPLLATNAVHYHDPGRRPLQDVLTCVRLGCSIHEAGYALFPNGERYLKSPAQMHRLFHDCPDALRRAVEVADRCAFALDELRYEYPDELVPPGLTAAAYLRQLTEAGARARYPAGVPRRVRDQVEHELALIARLRYEAYFLTVYDLVRFARSRDILCQGRGSAANSAVCYCLGVTSVDPATTDLLFERFVSAARGEPPDIDIDFEHERREEVIQYVYAKYGRERAGMTAEVITYRGRSAVRDVGKALGLSLDVVDQMAKRLDWWHKGTITPDQVREAGLDPDDHTVRLVTNLTAQLLGFPRHLSQHVGGLVMTRGPLCELVPIENASMPDRTVIEWDKDDIDVVGILKVDALALGMLTCVSKAFRLVAAVASRGEPRVRPSAEGEDAHLAHGPAAVASRLDRTAAPIACHGAELQATAEWPGGSERPSGGPEGEHEVRPYEGGTPSRGEACLRPPVRRGGGERANTRFAPTSGPAPVDAPDVGATPASPGSPSCAVPAEDAVGARPASPECVTPEYHPPGDAGVAPTGDPSSGGRATQASPLQLHTIPLTDPAVYDMIGDADTVGVFQIESRAQMSMLPRLRPRSFYDLVIEVAIVRPGPIQGDMVHPYLRRRSGEEPVTYPSEALRHVLEKTLGVPLFQEQAMKVAMVAAGFTADEADQLRRAMAAWKRGSGLERFHDQMVDGMLRNGYTRAFAEQCFHQIKGFGEYGFPESHAASFALLVYVSAWLKRYHPAAFAAALLNSQPMGFYAPAQIVRDAREHGVEVRPVDVNFSGWDCSLEGSDGATERRSDEGGEEGGLKIDDRGSRMAGGAPGGVPNDPPSSTLDPQSSTPPPSSLRPSVAPSLSSKSTWGAAGPALRIGLRQIKGLHAAHAAKIEQDRARRGPFASVADLHRRTRLPRHALQRLAEADAFASMGLSRREALWRVLELDDGEAPLFEGWESDEATERRSDEGGEERGSKMEDGGWRMAGDARGGGPNDPPSSILHPQSSVPPPSSLRPSVAPSLLPKMPIGQEVMTDYATAGLSLKRHPVSLVRDELARREVVTAADVMRTPHGRWVRVAGLVLIRQRPGTASGIVFETLEDETGITNLIVRPAVYDRYRAAARHAALVQADGWVERQGQVVHVMAHRLADLSDLLDGYAQRSRDFH